MVDWDNLRPLSAQEDFTDFGRNLFCLLVGTWNMPEEREDHA
jgi:hypothetical protein